MRITCVSIKAIGWLTAEKSPLKDCIKWLEKKNIFTLSDLSRTHRRMWLPLFNQWQDSFHSSDWGDAIFLGAFILFWRLSETSFGAEDWRTPHFRGTSKLSKINSLTAWRFSWNVKHREVHSGWYSGLFKIFELGMIGIHLDATRLSRLSRMVDLMSEGSETINKNKLHYREEYQ